MPSIATLLAMGAAFAPTAWADGLEDAPAARSLPDEGRDDWEGAIGLLVAHRPAFSGAEGSVTRLTPGFFLRRGRFSITNASGFVTRRSDGVSRGIGLDLLQGKTWKASVGLRWDNGRRESSSDELRGLGDIQPTARARFGLGWSLAPGWRLGMGLNADLFGRGGGSIADITISRELRVSPATVWSLALGASHAGDRYLQTWYGITPEQSLRSGRPAYEPRSGWRDVSASVGFRTELSRDWLLIGGAGTNRLLGSAAESPLVTARTGWGLNAGLAWRF